MLAFSDQLQMWQWVVVCRLLSWKFLRSALGHECKRIVGVSVPCMCCSLSQDQEGAGSLCLGEKLQMATDWSEWERLGSHEERQEKV